MTRIKRPVEIFPGLKMIENADAKIEGNSQNRVCVERKYLRWKNSIEHKA